MRPSEGYPDPWLEPRIRSSTFRPGPLLTLRRQADAKSWLGDTNDSNDRWLFKSVPEKSWGFRGDDWVEKVTTELAGLLGVPCARVELADRNGERGTIL